MKWLDDASSCHVSQNWIKPCCGIKAVLQGLAKELASSTHREECRLSLLHSLRTGIGSAARST